MDGLQGAADGAEEEARDLGGRSPPPGESGGSRSPSETQAVTAETSEEVAVEVEEEAASEAAEPREEPAAPSEAEGDEAPRAPDGPEEAEAEAEAQAQAEAEAEAEAGAEVEPAIETEAEQEEPEKMAGEEAEEPVQPPSEGEAEEAEEKDMEEEEEEEEAEGGGKKGEEPLEEREAGEEEEAQAAAEAEQQHEEATEEGEEEEEEEEAAEVEEPTPGKKTLSRGVSLQDQEATPARVATEERLEPGEEGEEEQLDGLTLRRLVPKDGEPERERSLQWTLEMEKEQEVQLRAELLHQYQTLMAERSRYQRYNLFLQYKIHEALRKKALETKAAASATAAAAGTPATGSATTSTSSTDLASDKGLEPESPEKEQAYLGYVTMLEDLRKQQVDDLAWYHQELEEAKRQCQYTMENADRDWKKFQALKKQVVMQAMGSCRMRGGRQVALREVEQILALEDKKEKEMRAVRLENVQLKQCLVHFETRMRAQEDLTEGLHLIDFEQLKIENQTFNEKVEERNEELSKLRSKVSSNVQIVTHVKEKLHFVDCENMSKKAQLQEMEAQLALRRDVLTKTKQARDSLRLENVRLNQKCGLLDKRSLLRDLEDKVNKTALLSERLESLKRHHASLTLSCRGMKQKIGEAKTFVPF